MQSLLSDLLSRLGVEPSETALDLATIGTYLVLLGLGAVIAFFLAKRVLLRAVRFTVQHTDNAWDDRLLEHKVFFWLAHLAPGAVLSAGAREFFEGGTIGSTLGTVAQVYMIAVGLLAVDAAINAALDIYSTFPSSHEIPLKSFAQVVKIVVYLAALLVALSALLGESPLVLLSGLGVVASVLMLVFKDAILGLVAGIQLAANRMLAKGDWLEMPSHNADGDVIEIALTTVKVQNWDKTITTIPTHALISHSFKNWRGMSEAGGRRIKRSIMIDMNTIRLCTPEMLERFGEIRHIASYIESKNQELVAWNEEHGIDGEHVVNARRMTNIGTFRAYVLAYLENHPDIRNDLTLLVRQLDPTPAGLPIQIYCFTNTTAWAEYEAIQADIFDHLLAVAAEFDLRVFQQPGGRDLERLQPSAESA